MTRVFEEVCDETEESAEQLFTIAELQHEMECLAGSDHVYSKTSIKQKLDERYGNTARDDDADTPRLRLRLDADMQQRKWGKAAEAGPRRFDTKELRAATNVTDANGSWSDKKVSQ